MGPLLLIKVKAMHSRPTLCTSLAVAALLACSPLLAQEAQRWKFSPGDQLRYEVSQATNTRVNAGEAGDFATDAMQILEVVWQIDEVDEAGVATGRQKIERIQLNITMPSGLALAYDSQVDESASGIAAMLTPLFEAILENEVPMRISPTGEVLECEMPGPMAERLARVPATRAMSYLVTAAGVRQVAEQIALPLADGDGQAVRKLVVENRVLGTLQGEVVWSPAESDEAGVARYTPAMKFAIEPAPSVDPDDSTQPQPLVAPSMIAESCEGAAEFDENAGRLTTSRLAIEFQLTGQLMGSDMVSNMKQTIEVTAK